jgi:hypothetical protein
MEFATEAQRHKENLSDAKLTEGAHARCDGEYAELVEGGGDRGAAWRM